MANDDSTRPDFDLSFWEKGDAPLTIGEAACLWYRLKPGMTTELTKLYPVEWANTQNRAEDMAKLAEDGGLPYEKPVPLTPGHLIERGYSNAITGERRPARYEMVPNWSAALVARADLRAYAESIGQRPAFLFPDIAGAETKHYAPTQSGAAGSNTNDPPAEWARGIRRIAWDAAAVIVKKGDRLTTDGLGKQMLKSDKVELRTDEYCLNSTDYNLAEREMKAKPATIAGWVTALKKTLKP